MMYSYLGILKTNSGKLKVAIIGQPSSHIMDWRGCNYRTVALPKELRKQFDLLPEAKAYAKELEATKEDTLRDYARQSGDGAYFHDSDFVL